MNNFYTKIYSWENVGTTKSTHTQNSHTLGGAINIYNFFFHKCNDTYRSVIWLYMESV